MWRSTRTRTCIGTMSSCSLMSWPISTMGVPQGQMRWAWGTSCTTSMRLNSAGKADRLPRAGFVDDWLALPVGSSSPAMSAGINARSCASVPDGAKASASSNKRLWADNCSELTPNKQAACLHQLLDHALDIVLRLSPDALHGRLVGGLAGLLTGLFLRLQQRLERVNIVRQHSRSSGLRKHDFQRRKRRFKRFQRHAVF